MPVSSHQVAFADAKKWSQRLKKSLLPHHPSLRLNECQEAVAQMLGFPHWHALSAQQASPSETKASLPLLSEQTFRGLNPSMHPGLVHLLSQAWTDDLQSLRFEMDDHDEGNVVIGQHRWGMPPQRQLFMPARELTEALRSLENTHPIPEPFNQIGLLTDRIHKGPDRHDLWFRESAQGDGPERLHLLQLFARSVQGRRFYTLVFYSAQRLAQFSTPFTFSQLGFTSTQEQSLQAWIALPRGLTLVLGPPDQGTEFTLAALGERVLRWHGDLFPQVHVVSQSPVLQGLKALGASVSTDPHERPHATSLLILDDLSSSEHMAWALHAVTMGIRVWASVRTADITHAALRLRQLGLTEKEAHAVHGSIFQQRIPVLRGANDVTGSFPASQLMASLARGGRHDEKGYYGWLNHDRDWHEQIQVPEFRSRLRPDVRRALDDQWDL
jgi:hypothetical protein